MAHLVSDAHFLTRCDRDTATDDGGAAASSGLFFTLAATVRLATTADNGMNDAVLIDDAALLNEGLWRD